MLNVLRRLFARARPMPVPPIPPWEQTVAEMQNSHVEVADRQTVEVIPSRDRTRRYVLMADQRGLYSYYLEELYPVDEEEWGHYYRDEEPCAAFWQPVFEEGHSLFATREEAFRDMESQGYWKDYFA